MADFGNHVDSRDSEERGLYLAHRLIDTYLVKYDESIASGSCPNSTLWLFQLSSASLATLSHRIATLPALRMLRVTGADHPGNGSLTSTPELAEAFAPLTHLPGLDLGSNFLTSSPDLAKALSSMTLLEELSLASNQLTSTKHLADALSGHDQLVRLNLDRNKIDSNDHFADAMSGLSMLKDLELAINRLSSTAGLTRALNHLQGIELLNLSGNTLTSSRDLALALSPLTSLRELLLHENRLHTNAHLADSLRRLVNLENLCLHTNRLQSTPELTRAIASLVRLKKLYLAANQLTATTDLTDAIRPLRALRSVDLRGNHLGPTHELADLLESTAAQRVDISDNPHLLPVELVRSSNDRIVYEIRNICDGMAQPHPEFKVVLLGEGRVGKTQLFNRLCSRQVNPDEPETRSFDWSFMGSVAWPPNEPAPQRHGRRSDVSRPVALDAAISVFDFGGQEALWASHRFFLSPRRTVFVVCASRMRTVIESRLEFWLRYIRHIWGEYCAAEAHRDWMEHAAKWQAGMPQPNMETLQDQAQLDTPCPPVVVVLTGAPGSLAEPSPELMEDARRICSEYGAALIEDYDSFEDSERHLHTVREHIISATYRPELRHVWTEHWSPELLHLLSHIRKDFGLNSYGYSMWPAARMLTLADYLSRYKEQLSEAGAHNGRETRRRALEDLRVLRDLGVVHWVGEHPDVIGTTDRIADMIFSPAAVRGPIYNVLWSKRSEAEPLTYAELLSIMREAGPDGFATEFDDDELALLIKLIEVCELVFATEHRGQREYFVPDRLPHGRELSLRADTPMNPMETLLRMELGFIPDMLMPRLIGQLWQRFRCEAMTRCSCTVYWELESDTVPVRLCADQVSGILLASVPSEADKMERIRAALEYQVSNVLKRMSKGLAFQIVRHPAWKASTTSGDLDSDWNAGALQDECRPSTMRGQRKFCIKDMGRGALILDDRDEKTINSILDYFGLSRKPQARTWMRACFKRSRAHMPPGQMMHYRLVQILWHKAKAQVSDSMTLDDIRTVFHDKKKAWVDPLWWLLIENEPEYRASLKKARESIDERKRLKRVNQRPESESSKQEGLHVAYWNEVRGSYRKAVSHLLHSERDEESGPLQDEQRNRKG